MGRLAVTDFAALAEGRSRLYWLLADCCLKAPGANAPARAAALADALELSGIESFLPTVPLLREAADAEDDEPLAPEFVRLFGGLAEGSGPPPPYESLVREGRLMGAVTAQVMAEYAEAGFGAIDESAGPQDHAGVELKYLALLCREEALAWAEGRRADARGWRRRQWHFLVWHLGAWLPGYCRGLAGEAHSAYFRAMATLTDAFIAAERQALSPRTTATPSGA